MNNFYSLALLSRKVVMGIFFMISLSLGSIQAQNWQVCRFVGTPSNTPFDSTGIGARFNTAPALTIDTFGNMYVGEYYAVRKVTPSGVVTTIAGDSATGYADGIGRAARFNSISGIVVDNRDGCLYVSDYLNHRIRKVVIATGAVTTLAGSTAGYADGVGEAAKFNSQGGLAFDPTTRMLYIADYQNNCIRKMNVATQSVTTIAGVRGTGATVDGIGTNARLKGPWGMTIKAGTLYLTEFAGNTIRKLDLNTINVTTIAGSNVEGYADSTGVLAKFKYPRSLFLDASDNIYVTDNGNSRIRKVTQQGVTTTFAGNGSFITNDGPLLSASFNSPSGIIINAAGEIIVSEYIGYIRKIAPTASATDNMTWIGNTGTDWNAPCNWSPYGVPTITNAVTIPNRPAKPLIYTGTNARAKKITIEAGATLNINASTASLTLANTGDSALIVRSGASIVNAGTINITAGLGISNRGTIMNNPCAKIIVAAGAYNNRGGVTTNSGLVQLVDTLDNMNGTFTNLSVLKFGSLGGSITNNTATSVIIRDNTIPIFTYGSATFDGTINGIFTNTTATTSAGTFTAPNEFRPLQTLPIGAQTLYAKVSQGNCSHIVPFRYTYTQRVATQDIENTTVLYQNRPNPFHKETIIAFALPQTTKATLSVFDITGKQIFVSDKTYNAGYNEIVLDQSVFHHTGTYFCRLTTDKQTIVRKMQFIAE